MFVENRDTTSMFMENGNLLFSSEIGVNLYSRNNGFYNFPFVCENQFIIKGL